MTLDDTGTTRHEAGCPDCTDGLGKAGPVPEQGWRDRIRRKPGLAQAWRIGVFLAGLLCVALGVALAVLPGPLTIPPVLLGLWIWSTEFAFAERLFDRFAEKGREAWAHFKAHPVIDGTFTVLGLAAAVAAAWAVKHYGLIEKAKDAVGL